MIFDGGKLTAVKRHWAAAKYPVTLNEGQHHPCTGVERTCLLRNFETKKPFLKVFFGFAFYAHDVSAEGTMSAG